MQLQNGASKRSAPVTKKLVCVCIWVTRQLEQGQETGYGNRIERIESLEFHLDPETVGLLLYESKDFISIWGRQIGKPVPLMVQRFLEPVIQREDQWWVFLLRALTSQDDQTSNHYLSGSIVFYGSRLVAYMSITPLFLILDQTWSRTSPSLLLTTANFGCCKIVLHENRSICVLDDFPWSGPYYPVPKDSKVNRCCRHRCETKRSALFWRFAAAKTLSVMAETVICLKNVCIWCHKQTWSPYCFGKAIGACFRIAKVCIVCVQCVAHIL